jgi:predicted DNA-binding transcriptional regulator AlpA
MALLGGVSEVAQHLNISRQRLNEVRQRNDFPQPVVELSSGPVWDMEAIERWTSSGARRGPGRPPADQRIVGGRFVLEARPLGTGGFADVYRAVDRRDGQVVAVKILKDIANADAEAVTRFRRELRLMESFDHPHVAKIVDQGTFEDRDGIWYAMPLAVGSLADEISTMQNDTATVTDLARQLCAGVGYVHERGVLHRDLKPGNILRTPDGRWQVADFGLAREDERMSQALTSTTAQGLGTAMYASPEQWNNPKHAEIRDDIYAIGKIVQHAITGMFPMAGAEHIADTPLRGVLQRATGPRADRYPDTGALLRALDQAVTGSTTAWVDADTRLARLRPRLSAPTLDTVAADELVTWLLSDDVDVQLKEATTAFAAASGDTLAYLWKSNPGGLRVAWSRIAEYIRATRFAWEFCDTVANTAKRLLDVTPDSTIIRDAVSALARMGTRHNRWHVRDTLISILQGVRDPERALAALEGLQDVPPSEVSWSISGFAARSMHPTLRRGIEDIVRATS